jgi:putative flippase GtrA
MLVRASSSATRGRRALAPINIEPHGTLPRVVVPLRQVARRRGLRFAVTGAVAAILQLVILRAETWLGWDSLLANVAAFALAAQVNFVLSQQFTWRDRPAAQVVPFARLRRWLRFHAGICGTALLNLGVFAVSRTMLPTLLAALLGIAVAGIVNYLLADHFVFRPPGRGATRHLGHARATARSRTSPPEREWPRALHRRVQVERPTRLASISLLAALLVGSLAAPSVAWSMEGTTLPTSPPSGLQLDDLVVGYRRGGSLGFALRDTVVDEDLYQRAEGAERVVVWAARFTSRWLLSENQLDRWSAQVIGLATDALGADVYIDGWTRLEIDKCGDHAIAYSYRLTTQSNAPAGEATIVALATGDTVLLGAVASVDPNWLSDSPVLGRLMDGLAES